MNSVDLGQPILLFILIFWSFMALAAIMSYVLKKGKISRVHFFQRWRSHHSSPRKT
jgi:hypothetical protein